MEAIIFMGLQASGKSTLYQRHFFHTHQRISMDLLNTRNREAKFLNVCVETSMPLVVDNTNPTREDRKRYIPTLKKNNYRIIGYYFQSEAKACVARNAERSDRERVPDVAVYATLKKLEKPEFDEGFDTLFYVSLKGGNFEIQAWKSDEI